MKLTIGYLYGDLMNIYGDTGNIICLTKRCQWRGIEVVVKNISLKDTLKKGEVDLYFFGGGQDQAQELVSKDLIIKGKVLKEEVERGVPLLSICGGYQLLGEYYQPFRLSQNRGDRPQKGPKIVGLGILPVYTEASSERMIGNIVVQSSLFIVHREKQNFHSMNNEQPASENERTMNIFVGFENHSGKTFLKKGGVALGKVVKGFGNNGEDKTEGCIYKNAIGCYMHGSLLPKNPRLADWLIEKSLEVKYMKKIELEILDDALENKAHDLVITRFL